MVQTEGMHGKPARFYRADEKIVLQRSEECDSDPAGLRKQQQQQQQGWGESMRRRRQQARWRSRLGCTNEEIDGRRGEGVGGMVRIEARKQAKETELLCTNTN